MSRSEPPANDASDAAPLRVKSGFSRAELRIERFPEGDAVVKDFRGKGLLFRRWIGPWLLDREERAYDRLHGAPGFPSWHRRLDRGALAIARVDGSVLSREVAHAFGIALFQRLEATVDRMHERGVLHFDLHQKRNILVTASGEPVLIDFASAFCLRPRRLAKGPLRILTRPDRGSILKFKARYLPELLDDRERSLVRRRHWLSAFWISRPLNAIKKRWVRRRRRRRDD